MNPHLDDEAKAIEYLSANTKVDVADVRSAYSVFQTCRQLTIGVQHPHVHIRASEEQGAARRRGACSTKDPAWGELLHSGGAPSLAHGPRHGPRSAQRAARDARARAARGGQTAAAWLWCARGSLTACRSAQATRASEREGDKPKGGLRVFLTARESDASRDASK